MRERSRAGSGVWELDRSGVCVDTHLLWLVRDVHPGCAGSSLAFAERMSKTLQARLAQTERDLATVRVENDGLTTDLNTANLALGETAGWSERLPVALGDLTNLAAGKPTDEDTKAHLAAAVLALAGEHLIAKVDVSYGEPAGELSRDTSFNENGRPIRTIARLGACSVDCTWQPAVNAGPNTAEMIEGLCAAVVCSLAGLATTRVQRHEVTQLGDERACSRRLALRHRLQQPCESVAVPSMSRARSAPRAVRASRLEREPRRCRREAGSPRACSRWPGLPHRRP